MNIGFARLGLFALSFSTLLLSPCSAGMVDQQQLVHNAGFGFGGGHITGEQEVVAGLSGLLKGFDFISNGIGLASSLDVNVFVKLGGATQPGNDVFQGTVTLPSSDVGSFFFVDTSSAGIQLSPGEMFTIGLTPQGPFDLGIGVNNPYPQGNFYFNSVAQSADMTFRTYVSAVPEPSSLAMGFIGLGMMSGTLLLCRVASRRRPTRNLVAHRSPTR